MITCYSCESEGYKIEKNTYDILSLLVDKFGEPMIPPRELYNLEPFSKKQKDSILNQKVKIVIYPILKKSSKRFSSKENLSVEFNELLSDIKRINKKTIVDLSKFKIKRPYQLSILDTNKLKRDVRYVRKNFDKLLNLYVISFNEDYSKAVTISGVSNGYLNGYSSLVFLEKIDGKWEIKYIDTFSIS